MTMVVVTSDSQKVRPLKIILYYLNVKKSLIRSENVLQQIFPTPFSLQSNFLETFQYISDIDIKPVDKTDFQNIILSLNPLRALGLNSISAKILKLLSNDISSHLTELVNFSWPLGAFASICLKPSKIISIFERESKLNLIYLNL